MKKIGVILTAVLLTMVLAMSVTGCTRLDESEGIEALQMAYANTRDNYSDIYQFIEKVNTKPKNGESGSIVNRVVNVNCAVDKDYNILKDKDFAISIHEDKYLESVDANAKITTRQIAANDISIGETWVSDDKSKTTIDALFVDSWTNAPNVSCESHNYERGIKAKDFYASDYFAPKKLMNKQIMQEIALLDATNMDFDIEKGGIVKKGRTTDYNFRVTDEYISDYESTNGRESLLAGKRVWLQISYGRISNIYVYRDEDLGAGLTAEYESYIFMITYLGKRVDPPKIPAASAVEPSHIEMDIFDGQAFGDAFLSPVISD